MHLRGAGSAWDEVDLHKLDYAVEQCLAPSDTKRSNVLEDSLQEASVFWSLFLLVVSSICRP